MQVNEHFPLRGIDYSALAATADRVVYIREKDTPIFPPPCECIDCGDQLYFSSEQNMPQFAYTGKVSDAEAKKILGDFVAGIYSDHQFLEKQCHLHGDVIMNRWKKKNRDKRAVLLIQVQPNLYPHQWFLPRYTNASPHWKDTRKFRNAFLLPNLNVSFAV